MSQKKTAQRNGARPARGRTNTERKRAEEALRASEATYRAIFNAANEGIIVLDMQTGQVVDANATFRNVFGYAPEEARGLRVGDFSSGEPAYTQQDALRLIHEAADGEPQHFEWLAKSRDGNLLWIDVTLKRATIAGRDCVLAVGRDVTERKRAEEALRQSEERVHSVVANAPVILFAVDREGLFTLAEGKGLTALGVNPHEHIGLSVFDLYRDVPEIVEAARRALVGEAFTTTARAEELVFEAHVAPVRDHDGRITGAIAVATDITERKQAEEALQKAREELEARVERQMERGNPYGLTFRELTVLHVVAAGKADKEIASQLGISPLTASKHLANILSKMDAASRTEAGVRALREGLLD